MEQLDEKKFVRHHLFGMQQGPKWKQYASFVISRQTVFSLLDYELRVLLFGWIPGALGLFLRRKIYKKLFCEAGKNIVIGCKVTIRHGEKIKLGDNVILDDGCLVDGRGAGQDGDTIGSGTIVGRSSIIQSKLGPIQIGANVNIGSYSVITSQGGVNIGDWVQIAGGCKISGGRFKLDKEMTNGIPFKRFSQGPISIGTCCFIGGSSQITDGVTIGSYSALGAGSVVVNSIPEGSVYMPRPGMIMGTTLTKPPGTESTGV